MAVNTLKPVPKERKANAPRPVVQPVAPRPPRQKGTSIFQLLDKYLKVDRHFEDGVPVRYLPHTLFLMALAIFYIGNSHYAERTIRNIEKVKTEAEDLRADYTTLKSDYMEASKQSEVAKSVAPAGLIESSSPPYKILVSKDEY